MSVIDDLGITGLVMDYAMIVFFSFGSMILFIFFWWKKRLDFDEEPKYKMLEEDYLDE